jgi:hypothetical protein
MFVASTRERQKIPVSQITRGPNTARLSCSSSQSNYHSRKDIEELCWDSSNGRNTNEETADKRS